MRSFVLFAVLPLYACTNNFNALSENSRSRGRTPMVTVTMNNADTLPLCSRSTEGVTAFLAKAGTVFLCSQGDWVAADPTHSKWVYGHRTSIRYNQWEDLSTRKRWALAPLRSDIASSCDRGWRLPARRELVVASANGLFEGIRANGGTAFPRAWTSEFETREGRPQRIVVSIDNAKNPDETTTGVYCVLDT